MLRELSGVGMEEQGRSAPVAGGASRPPPVHRVATHLVPSRGSSEEEGNFLILVVSSPTERIVPSS